MWGKGISRQRIRRLIVDWLSALDSDFSMVRAGSNTLPGFSRLIVTLRWTQNDFASAVWAGKWQRLQYQIETRFRLPPEWAKAAPIASQKGS